MTKYFLPLFIALILLILLWPPIKVSTPLVGTQIKAVPEPVIRKDSEAISLEKIFYKNHSWVDKLDKARLRILIATGDVIPARSVNYQIVTRKNFNWPYENIADFLKSADITFINLETPLINNCPLTQEGMIFCGDSKNVEGLVYSGVDVVSLANNHAANYGEKAVLETVALLKKMAFG